MRPNPIDMLVFLEVAEARSFTAAANRLGKTTSAVSQAVSRLEHELGNRLFYRTTRSLSLTDAGMRALSHCRDLKRIYQDATADLKNANTAATGTLSVTAPHALSTSIVGPALQGFLSDNPGMKCRLVADDMPIDMIEHRIDLAIRVGEPRQQAARMSKIGTLKESLYCGTGLVTELGGLPSRFQDLNEWDHIANDWQGAPVTYIGPDGGVVKVTPRIRCNSVLDAHNFAVAGAGIALLPELLTGHDEGRNNLVRLYPISESPIYAVHMFEGQPPPMVRQFIAYLKTRLRPPP